MYNNILIAYDGSAGSKNALNHAISITKAFNSKLTAIWIGGYRSYYHETVAEIEEENKSILIYAAKINKELQNISKQENIEIDFVYLQGNPAKLIVEFAQNNHIDLLVIGCRGHSNLWGNSLGQVADKVSENAKCNVLIIRK
jgi:nucleotide-binding universal stress UspA family protein